MSHFIQMANSGRFTYGDEGTIIALTDVAHHLSMVARYAGATKFHYSVGQHSIGMVRLIQRAGGSLRRQRQALVHDGHEAVMGDFPTPFQNWITDLLDGRDILDEAKHRIDAVMIPQLIGGEYPWSAADSSYIRYFDKLMFLIESTQLFIEGAPSWWGDYAEVCGIDTKVPLGVMYPIEETKPEDVKRQFIDLYCELMNGEDNPAEDKKREEEWVKEYGYPFGLRVSQ